MVVCADSSFLVSLLVEDGNSIVAKKFLARHPDSISVTSFSKSETQHAIRNLAFRKDISVAEMSRALFQLEHDEAEGFLNSVPLETDAIFLKASQLSSRYTLEFGVRYLDTLHIASALLINARRFLTFDLRQRKLAEAVGLEVKF